MPKPKTNFFHRKPKFHGPKTNERIRSLDVQVINSAGDNLGILPIKKAIEVASEICVFTNNNIKIEKI